MLTHLDGRYPGIRFRIIDEQDRIQPHIKFFVDGTLVTSIAQPIGPDDEVHIICALSRGSKAESAKMAGLKACATPDFTSTRRAALARS